GYNGVPSGSPHCSEEVEEVDSDTLFTDMGLKILLTPYPYACGGTAFKTGEGLDFCDAVHAEQNALVQCRDVDRIHTCYTTVSPCVSCTKLLMNTLCVRVVFRDDYAQSGERLWTASRRLGWSRQEAAR